MGLLSEVHFDFDKADIRDVDRAVLQQMPTYSRGSTGRRVS
jgi:hypothetical protein